MTRFARNHKILLTCCLVGAAVGLAGLGSYASFTSQTSAQAHTVTSGTMTLTIPAAGASNRLTVGASDIAPGDTIQRAFNLTSGGTLNPASITLTSTATASSLLDSDAANGLQMTIDKCSVAWTEAGPPYTYTCGGTTSSVLGSRAVIGSNIALSNMSLTSGSTDYLRLTLTLPSSTGNTLQGQSSTISYQFTGTQRAATNK
ncbi:MAG: TasA family protein [Gaiellaceae bacterium]